jgi:hypothetical protein
MPEKRETLEELARREADGEREREEARALRRQSSERLAKEVPARFFQLAKELREAVARFNAAALPEKRLTFHESTALAAHDPNLNADFNCALSRAGVEVTLTLNAMGRSGKPDVFLIEASCRLGDDQHMVRCEGSIGQGGKAPKVDYRISIDFQRMSYSIDELAERLVKSAVKIDPDELRG